MKIPEIERDLKDVDPRIRYWFKYQQEQILSLQQTIDQAAELLVKFYLVLQNLQTVNENLRTEMINQGIDHDAVQKTADKLMGKKESGMVKSVLNHPEDENG